MNNREQQKMKSLRSEFGKPGIPYEFVLNSGVTQRKKEGGSKKIFFIFIFYFYFFFNFKNFIGVSLSIQYELVRNS